MRPPGCRSGSSALDPAPARGHDRSAGVLQGPALRAPSPRAKKQRAEGPTIPAARSAKSRRTQCRHRQTNPGRRKSFRTGRSRRRKNSRGVQLFAPSGAGLWASPTIDESRRRHLPGDSGRRVTKPPVPNTTDAVMALDLTTGKVKWCVQHTANDAWLVGCEVNNPSELPR